MDVQNKEKKRNRCECWLSIHTNRCLENVTIKKLTASLPVLLQTCILDLSPMNSRRISSSRVGGTCATPWPPTAAPASLITSITWSRWSYRMINSITWSITPNGAWPRMRAGLVLLTWTGRRVRWVEVGGHCACPATTWGGLSDQWSQSMNPVKQSLMLKRENCEVKCWLMWKTFSILDFIIFQCLECNRVIS